MTWILAGFELLKNPLTGQSKILAFTLAGLLPESVWTRWQQDLSVASACWASTDLLSHPRATRRL